MARGRRVQLINVSVLPGCWSEGCSFTRLRCVAQSQLQTRPGRGNKFPGPGGRGVWIRPERVTLTLGSDLLARVRMRP